MNDLMRNLKKQLQLLEIEIGNFSANKKSGMPSIHPDIYYVKLAHVHKRLKQSVKILSTVEDDIYNNFNYIEQ